MTVSLPRLGFKDESTLVSGEKVIIQICELSTAKKCDSVTEDVVV